MTDNPVELAISRRHVLLAGAALSTAMAMPSLAFSKSIPSRNEGTFPMTESFVKNKDGVEIYFKDSGQP